MDTWVDDCVFVDTADIAIQAGVMACATSSSPRLIPPHLRVCRRGYVWKTGRLTHGSRWTRIIIDLSLVGCSVSTCAFALTRYRLVMLNFEND